MMENHGLKANNERQDDGTVILHQVAQHPIDQVYLYTRHPCPFPPTQDLERQGFSCRAGRSTTVNSISETPTPGFSSHLVLNALRPRKSKGGHSMIGLSAENLSKYRNSFSITPPLSRNKKKRNCNPCASFQDD